MVFHSNLSPGIVAGLPSAFRPSFESARQGDIKYSWLCC